VVAVVVWVGPGTVTLGPVSVMVGPGIDTGVAVVKVIVDTTVVGTVTVLVKVVTAPDIDVVNVETDVVVVV